MCFGIPPHACIWIIDLLSRLANGQEATLRECLSAMAAAAAAAAAMRHAWACALRARVIAFKRWALAAFAHAVAQVAGQDSLHVSLHVGLQRLDW